MGKPEHLWLDTAEGGGRCRVICRGECCSRLSNVFLARGHFGLDICVCNRSSTIHRSSISAGRRRTAVKGQTWWQFIQTWTRQLSSTEQSSCDYRIQQVGGESTHARVYVRITSESLKKWVCQRMNARKCVWWWSSSKRQVSLIWWLRLRSLGVWTSCRWWCRNRWKQTKHTRARLKRTRTHTLKYIYTHLFILYIQIFFTHTSSSKSTRTLLLNIHTYSTRTLFGFKTRTLYTHLLFLI